MEEFSKRFAPFLENNLVEIKVNNKLCKPYIINLTVEGKHNINIKLPSGNNEICFLGTDEIFQLESELILIDWLLDKL